MWVVGVEGDFGWADNNSKTIAGIPGAENPTIIGSPGLDTASVKETWDAGARLRAGYLITPRLMVFATGGASWLRVQASAFCGSPFVVGWCIGPPGPTNVGSTSTASATALGWTIGGGLEWMLTQNWLLRGEYRYADYQQFNYTLFPGNAAAGLGTDAILANTKTHTQTLSGGLAYKF
jgi:outer membrane immunogenic protein